jgi:hypothetical protein
MHCVMISVKFVHTLSAWKSIYSGVLLHAQQYSVSYQVIAVWHSIY